MVDMIKTMEHKGILLCGSQLRQNGPVGVHFKFNITTKSD